MLEPVSLHQSRFRAPGISADARGVALGREGAVHFATLDGLVAWFRVLSDETSLDELLPALAIHELRGPVGALAFLVVFQAESSLVIDRAARIAAILGGRSYTGSGKHLVQYRDAEAPLGYDIDAISTEPGDFVLYGRGGAQPFRKARLIPFSQLVFRLSPRRLSGTDDADREQLYLAVAPGLAERVLGYLQRNQAPASAALVEGLGPASAFGRAPGTLPRRYVLVRAPKLPLRMLALFSGMPGVVVYRAATDQVLVEIGHRHPFQLSACRSVFLRDRFYLFRGGQPEVEVIGAVGVPVAGGAAAATVTSPPSPGSARALAGAEGPIPFVDVDRLITVGWDLGAAVAANPPASTDPRPASPVGDAGLDAPLPSASARKLPSLRISLRLVPSSAAPRRVVASLLGWEHAAQWKRLAFALPPPVLAGCRVAPIADGLLVVGGAGMEALPIGDPYYEVAPSIYLPLGTEFLPRVPEAVLADYVGGVEGRRVIFRRGEPLPIAVPEAAFAPLSRRVLGRIEVSPRERSPRGGPSPTTTPVEVEVRNDALGPLPLWGYRGQPAPPGALVGGQAPDDSDEDERS